MWQHNMSLERVEHIVLVKLSMCQICERCVSCDLWHGQKHVWKSTSKMWLVLSRTLTYHPQSSVINLGSDIIIWNENSNQVSESRKVSNWPNKFCTAPSFGKVQVPPPLAWKAQLFSSGYCRSKMCGEYLTEALQTTLQNIVWLGEKRPEFVTKQWFWFEVRHSHKTHKRQCQQ